MEIDLGPSLCPSILMREPAKTMGEGREKGSLRLKDEKKLAEMGHLRNEKFQCFQGLQNGSQLTQPSF